MAGGRFVSASPLPGFGLTFGFTTFFLSAVILLPLAAMVIRALGIPLSDLVDMLLDERAVASYRLSFGAAALAAAINAVFGFIVAWSLVRYDFPGRRLLDTMIDLPSRCRPRSPASRSRPSSRRPAGSGEARARRHPGRSTPGSASS
jgi:sulfate transport system permease protein